MGTFSATPATAGSPRWVWSDMVFVIHGFAPGEVRPTTDLWVAHAVGGDRECVRAALTGASPGPVSIGYTLRDARAHERRCMLVVAAGGRRGALVDMTEAWRRSAAASANAAIRSATDRTAPVDQAVGVLMGVHHVPAAVARHVLAAWARDTRRDLSAAAQALVHDCVRDGVLAAELGTYVALVPSGS